MLSLICLPCTAKIISEDSAMVVAQKFLKVKPQKQTLVRWSGRRLTDGNEKKRSQEPYYIFTNSDGVGFVIVAGDVKNCRNIKLNK